MTARTLDPAADPAVDLTARRSIAAALALALRDPSRADAPADAAPPADLIAAAWDVLAARHADVPQSALGLGEIVPAAADPLPLARWLALPIADRRAAYRAVFGLVFSRQCPPYETEYCQSRDIFHRSQQMADIGGFYRAFGIGPDESNPDRIDHASHALAYAAFLLEKIETSARDSSPAAAEHREVCLRALAMFVTDHVAWWMPTLGRSLEAQAARVAQGNPASPVAPGAAMLQAIGRLLRAWVAAERLAAGIQPARRIIEASVDEEPAVDEACDTCDTSCHRSPRRADFDATVHPPSP